MFDKTGTLTHATPQVVQVVPFSGCEEREVLQLAACLEEHFPHSMANAVVRAARERGISHEEMHSEVEYIVAHGIASRVGGERVVIGSHHFVFEDEHCTVPAGEMDKFNDLDPQYSHLYMAASGQLVGVICIADPLRPEAAHVLRLLDGQQLALPVYFDWEPVFADDSRTKGNDSRLTECAAAFCGVIESGGYQAGIYLNRQQGYYRYDLSRLADYALWVADYNDYPDFYYAFDM